VSAQEPWTKGFFDEAMAGLLFDGRKELEAPSEARGLMRLTGLQGGSVLDVACGTGRHSGSFAAMGMQVTGIDASPMYLKRAKARLQEAGHKARFVKADLKDLKAFKGRFDLVVNLFTSFGYLPTAAANERSLKQMVGCLRPGGWLAVELLPRISLKRITEPEVIQRIPGGWLFEQRWFSDDGRFLHTRVTWDLKKGRREQNSVFQTYDRAELAGLFKKAGLSRIKAYGDFHGRPFKAGDRLLTLGCKA
jgi:SAM-dependent methyltransferase